MPGPKPMSGKEMALRWATPERGNYRLLEVLEERKFRVRCLECKAERLVVISNNTTLRRCVCTHKRPFYRNKRTPELHTKEIRTKGYKRYTCIRVTDSAKGKYTYKHSCGAVFKMTKDCFLGSTEPCASCRPSRNLSHREVVRDMRRAGFVFKLAEEFVGSRGRIKVKYPCGCVTSVIKDRLRRHDVDVAKFNKCPVCYPNRVWFTFEIDNVEFRTRSTVERSFVEWLVAKGIPASKVEYEPSEKVAYRHPETKRMARYSPDFKVGRTTIEVKDCHSLGIGGATYRGIPSRDVLIENRAKMKAADAQFEDYRVYVKTSNGFDRVDRSFWTR